MTARQKAILVATAPLWAPVLMVAATWDGMKWAIELIHGLLLRANGVRQPLPKREPTPEPHPTRTDAPMPPVRWQPDGREYAGFM